MKVNMLTAAAVLFFATAIAFLAGRAGDTHSNVAATGAIEKSSRKAPDYSQSSLGDMGYAGDGPVETWIEAGLTQAYTVDDANTVTIYETVGSSLSAYVFTASFNITASGSSGKNLFYFAGAGSNGDAVIERWRLRKVGHPFQGIVGQVIRTDIYRGASLGVPRAMQADPQERFILVVSGEGGSSLLHRVPIQAGATPTLLHDALSAPSITTTAWINRYDHVDASLGRVWLLYSEATEESLYQWTSPALILYDVENDGIFDGEVVEDGQTVDVVFGYDSVFDDPEAANY